MTETKEVKRATAGFIVSLIAGILDAIVAILVFAASKWVEGFEGIIPGYGDDLGVTLATWGIVGLVLAILVIIGAVMIYMPGYELIGGILVLVFSIIGLFFTAGGLFMGLVLGIVGGSLGIAKK